MTFACGDRVIVRDPLRILSTQIGYVKRQEKETLDGMATYQVYLPTLHSYPVYRESWLHHSPVPEPIILCKGEGKLVEVEYKPYGTIIFSGEHVREFGILAKARREAKELAFYCSAFDPATNKYAFEPREYWVGYPTGTCYTWECYSNRPERT